MRHAHILGRAAAGLWLVVLAACAGSRSHGSSPSSRPPPNAANGGACGAPIFADARCESLVSYACCNEKNTCAGDASCNRLAQCMMGCKHQQRDACALACVQGEPPSPAAQRGLALYHQMLDCAGRAKVQGCSDDS